MTGVASVHVNEVGSLRLVPAPVLGSEASELGSRGLLSEQPSGTFWSVSSRSASALPFTWCRSAAARACSRAENSDWQTYTGHRIAELHSQSGSTCPAGQNRNLLDQHHADRERIEHLVSSLLSVLLSYRMACCLLLAAYCSLLAVPCSNI